MKVSKALLLGVYAVIPVALVIVLVDLFGFQGELRDLLPSTPEALFAFLIFFRFPHIVASFFSFFDASYFQHYWRLLGGALFGIGCILWIFHSSIGEAQLTIVYGLLTVHHVIGQQFGIAAWMTGRRTRETTVWKYLGILIVSCVYLEVSVPALSTSLWIHTASALLLIPFLTVAWSIQKVIQDRQAIRSIQMNAFMILSIWFFARLQYPFLAILIPRVVHDLTAFAFYVAHDTQRNQPQVRNILYRFGMRLGLPAIVLCPLMAIVLAFPLTYFEQMPWVLKLISAITLLHYFTESWIWRKGSPHRQELLLA